MGLQRRYVTFHGSVQGIGFRFTACQLAEGYDVTGYVRNQPDGTVEMVVEGDHEQIDEFVQRVRKRIGSHIQRMDQQVSAPRNEFRGFGLRH